MELHIKAILALCLLQLCLNIAAFVHGVMIGRKAKPRRLPDTCSRCLKEIGVGDIQFSFHNNCMQEALTLEVEEAMERRKQEKEVCPYAGGKNGGRHSIDCRCEIDGVIR